MVIQRADRKDSKLRCQNVQFRNSEENQTSYPQNKVFYTNVVRRYAFLVGYNAWRFSPILVPRARDPSGLWLGSQSIRFAFPTNQICSRSQPQARRIVGSRDENVSPGLAHMGLFFLWLSKEIVRASYDQLQNKSNARETDKRKEKVSYSCVYFTSVHTSVILCLGLSL